MKIIAGAIGAGKTTKLVLLSAETQTPILVKTLQERTMVLEIAKSLNAVIPNPVIGTVKINISPIDVGKPTPKKVLLETTEHEDFFDNITMTTNLSDVEIISRNDFYDRKMKECFYVNILDENYQYNPHVISKDQAGVFYTRYVLIDIEHLDLFTKNPKAFLSDMFGITEQNYKYLRF